MATHSSVLAWKFHGQRNLVSYSPWGGKEADKTEHVQTHNGHTALIYCKTLSFFCGLISCVLQHRKIHFDFNEQILSRFLQPLQALYASSADSVSETTSVDQDYTLSHSSSCQRYCRISYSIDKGVKKF